MAHLEAIDCGPDGGWRPRADIDPSTVSLSTALVKTMLGGEWPSDEESEGFGFESVDHYELEDGRLIPFDGFDSEAPGPDFKLVMIPFL